MAAPRSRAGGRRIDPFLVFLCLAAVAFVVSDRGLRLRATSAIFVNRATSSSRISRPRTNASHAGSRSSASARVVARIFPVAL